MRSYIKRYVSDGVEYVYYRPTPAHQALGAKSFRLVSDDPEAEAAEFVSRIESGVFTEENERFSRHVREIYRKARARAADRGIGFDLCMEDVTAALLRSELRCEVTGIGFRMEVGSKGYREPFRPSLDRIDASRGYEPSNIRMVCVAVNTAMADWGEDVFWAVVEGAKKRRKRPERRPDLSRGYV